MAPRRFSDFLSRRRRIWWPPLRWTRPWRWPAQAHQVADMQRLRRHDAPESSWRCCQHWQRALSHKWNSREFAVRHGVRVPQLYWHGRVTSRIPWPSLSPQVVFRPSLGAFTQGVHVFDGDHELLRDVVKSREAWRQQIRSERGFVMRRPLLIEAFVRDEAGRCVLPVEYKFYSFGGDIALVHVIDRTCLPGGRYWFLHADWTPFPMRVNAFRELSRDPIDPPRCYDEMLAAARRLGAAYETFVRIDFYATDQGAVFSEFAATPYNGRAYTEEGQRYLGEYWATVMPDRV